MDPDDDRCPRCGHDRKTEVSTARRVSLTLRRRSTRVTCGAPTDAGWICPCRSRWHAD